MWKGEEDHSKQRDSQEQGQKRGTECPVRLILVPFSQRAADYRGSPCTEELGERHQKQLDGGGEAKPCQRCRSDGATKEDGVSNRVQRCGEKRYH